MFRIQCDFDIVVNDVEFGFVVRLVYKKIVSVWAEHSIQL